MNKDIIFNIKTVSSGRYLDGRDGRKTPYMTRRNPIGDRYLQWQIVNTNVGFALRSASSNNYLDGRNGEQEALMTNRNPMNDCVLSWRLIPLNTAQTFALQSISSNKYLRDQGSNGTGRRAVLMCGNNPFNDTHLQWQFTPALYNLIDDGIYSIRNLGSNKVFDINQASFNIGSKIIHHPFHGGNNQLFEIKHINGGWYSIKCMNSNLFLEVKDTNIIEQNNWNGSVGQQFKFITLENNNKFGIITRISDKAIDIPNINGAIVYTHGFHGHPNQLFYLDNRRDQYFKNNQIQSLTIELNSWDIQLNQFKTELEEITIRYNTKLDELNNKKAEIKIEENEIKEFIVERNDKNTKIIIMLGHTGDGKSTLGNRLCGDNSKFGDQGANGFKFKTSGASQSCTQDFSKTIVNINNSKITIVDTPGFCDSYGRDAKHSNKLCKYLRGCGGVNAFILVRNATNVRFDTDFKSLLEQYKNMFGNIFFERLIIFATRCDHDNEEFERNKLETTLQNDICAQFGLNINIPVLPIGKYNYKNSINRLVEIIPSDKFCCQDIVSPFDTLQQQKAKFAEEYNILNQKRNKKQAQFNDVQQKRNETQQKINSLQ